MTWADGGIENCGEWEEGEKAQRQGRVRGDEGLPSKKRAIILGDVQVSGE